MVIVSRELQVLASNSSAAPRVAGKANHGHAILGMPMGMPTGMPLGSDLGSSAHRLPTCGHTQS